ncbi:hypothetical protein WUBG_02918, partial [Wuchereria bancrofti]
MVKKCIRGLDGLFGDTEGISSGWWQIPEVSVQGGGRYRKYEFRVVADTGSMSSGSQFKLAGVQARCVTGLKYGVWFQNRRSKERRMKQLRFGGYRPIRRSKTSTRDELCVPQGDIYSHGVNNDGFYGQLPLSFFCDGYGSVGPDGTPPTALPHPSFIMPSEAQPVHVDQSNSDNTFLEESLRPPHSSPNMPLAAQ